MIKNNDLKAYEGVKGINKIAGLEWQDIDPDAIEAINMERAKNYNLKGMLSSK